MKFNLKKLKDCIDTANELPRILKWIDGFEAELRERLEEYAQQFYTEKEIHLIKEILGDEF